MTPHFYCQRSIRYKLQELIRHMYNIVLPKHNGVEAELIIIRNSITELPQGLYINIYSVKQPAAVFLTLQ